MTVVQYLHKSAYRFNTRKMKDVERFIRALRGIVGKGLTYGALTGGEATA